MSLKVRHYHPPLRAQGDKNLRIHKLEKEIQNASSQLTIARTTKESWAELTMMMRYVWKSIEEVRHLVIQLVLCPWCYSYISGIIHNDSIIHIYMFDPNSRTVTRISIWDLPSGFGHRLVISPLPDLCINWSMTTVKPSVNKMCIIFGSVLVATSLFSMVPLYGQECLLLVADQTTIQSCFNLSFLGRWGVVNIRLPWHLEICRVIWERGH